MWLSLTQLQREEEKRNIYFIRSEVKQNKVGSILFERTQKLCTPKNAKSWKSSCPLNNTKASNMQWYKSTAETVWNEEECFWKRSRVLCKGCWISRLSLALFFLVSHNNYVNVVLTKMFLFTLWLIWRTISYHVMHMKEVILRTHSELFYIIQ